MANKSAYYVVWIKSGNILTCSFFHGVKNRSDLPEDVYSLIGCDTFGEAMDQYRADYALFSLNRLHICI